MWAIFFVIFVFSFSGDTLTTVSRANCDELQKVTQEINSDVATRKAELDRIKRLYAKTDQEANQAGLKHTQAVKEKRSAGDNSMVRSRYESLVSAKSMLYHLHLKLIRLEEHYKAAQQVQRAYRSERNVCRDF